jgi:hypothetical protein
MASDKNWQAGWLDVHGWWHRREFKTLAAARRYVKDKPIQSIARLKAIPRAAVESYLRTLP